MQVRIEAHDLPGRSCGPAPDRPGGHQGIHVGLQRRGRPDDVLGLVPADAATASWTAEVSPTARPDGGVDLKGPYVQGPPGGRFLYLSWLATEADGSRTMFRRAKLMLDAVPTDVLEQAVADGVLVGRLGLTDDRGNPRCAAVRPPVITWAATPA